MIFVELESFFSLLGRAKRFVTEATSANPSIASRFVKIFESHAIHRNQIPHFVNGKLTHAQVQDDETLLNALDEELLVEATSKFAVRRGWLDGADRQIYPLHDFYKKPEQFATWIETLSSQPGSSTGVLMVAKDEAHEFDALLVFEEQFAWIGEKPIYRYHLCNNCMFSYWKSRAYLTACVALAWKRSVYVSGRYVGIDNIRQYQEGQAFLNYSFDSALPMSGQHWYPEDLALRPDVFLEGLDEDAFGRRSGLELWLRLHKMGLMDSNLPSVPSAQPAFKSALNELRRSASSAS